MWPPFMTALDARELFISDSDINTTCSYSLLDVRIVIVIICLLVVVSSWSSFVLIHHSLPDSAGRGTTYNSILSTVWQCAGMGGGGCYWIPQGDRSCRSLDSDENCKPQHSLLSRDIKICRDLHTFWKTFGKIILFWVKNSVFWARSALLHGIYCISY